MLFSTERSVKCKTIDYHAGAGMRRDIIHFTGETSLLLKSKRQRNFEMRYSNYWLESTTLHLASLMGSARLLHLGMETHIWEPLTV
jgi:hypothetical protein